jgi:hypothetical protein
MLSNLHSHAGVGHQVLHVVAAPAVLRYHPKR